MVSPHLPPEVRRDDFAHDHDPENREQNGEYLLPREEVDRGIKLDADPAGPDEPDDIAVEE